MHDAALESKRFIIRTTSSGSGEIAAPKRVRLFIRDCDELGREWLLKQFVSKVEGEDGSLISG